MLDLKIEGATVVDGTGGPGSRAGVGVRDGTITSVGDLSREPAGRGLHASRKVLPPGLIDMHSMGEYLDAFDADGLALNVVHLVGHGTLRVAAMGFARRPPTDGELTTMQRLLASAIEAGAWGLSTGSSTRRSPTPPRRRSSCWPASRPGAGTRRARRDARRLSTHGLQHVAADAAARLSAGGRRGGHAGAGVRRRHPGPDPATTARRRAPASACSSAWAGRTS
jgi:N-acyl-D-aspartate/D-glutamate deacylase